VASPGTAGSGGSIGAAEPSEQPDAAVDRLNGELAAGYGFESVGAASSTDGISTLRVAKQTAHAAPFAARLTVPLGRSFGLRLGAAGGPEWFSTRSVDDLAGGVTSRTELLWRDPTLGHVAAGYAFEWEDLPISGQTVSHGAVVDAAWYFPDLGTGPVDWRVRVQYGRARRSGPGVVAEHRNDVDLLVDPAWYVNDVFRIASRFAWRREDFDDARGSDRSEYGSDLAAEWLVGAIGQRRVSLTMLGGYRRSALDLEPPSTDLRRNVWTFRLGVRVLSHPVNSLLDLYRRRR
jgi:hypothetical protein